MDLNLSYLLPVVATLGAWHSLIDSNADRRQLCMHCHIVASHQFCALCNYISGMGISFSDSSANKTLVPTYSLNGNEASYSWSFFDGRCSRTSSRNKWHIVIASVIQLSSQAMVAFLSNSGFHLNRNNNEIYHCTFMGLFSANSCDGCILRRLASANHYHGLAVKLSSTVR